jgi:(2Fe-2S) ferredoxin
MPPEKLILNNPQVGITHSTMVKSKCQDHTSNVCYVVRHKGGFVVMTWYVQVNVERMREIADFLEKCHNDIQR